MSGWDEPWPLWSFRGRCRHSWITRGYASPVIWNKDHTEGRSDPAQTVSIAETGPICTFCGAHRRLFSDYPRQFAPMVAP